MGSSDFVLVLILMTFTHTLSCVLHSNHTQRVVNVDDYYPKADGVTDDSKAFAKAWKETCSSSVPAVLEVPANRTYLLNPIEFAGPCKSNATFMIKGKVEAPLDRSIWNDNDRKRWIVFDSIRDLVVTGGGIINGNGHIWWKHSCKLNEALPCIPSPTALTFIRCKRLKVSNLRLKDSPQIHLVLKETKKASISKIFITAPEKSPNTDGIHLNHAKNVHIRNCDIRTGDDCVSIVSGSENVKISRTYCGPGHGISIGSLGKNKSSDRVRNVFVDGAIFNGTTNGVRIKSWQGGLGYAKNIVFQNITMHDVKNPIIIDQNYCDRKKKCHEQSNAVAVSRVLYKNIKGTSASKVSVKFDCSKNVPCHGIKLEDINLTGKEREKTRSLCNNVHLTKRGTVVPHTCV